MKRQNLKKFVFRDLDNFFTVFKAFVYAAEQAAAKADRRKLGAINVVNIDTGEVEVQGGFTAGGQVRLDKGEMSQIGDGGKSRVGGTTIGARSVAGAQSTENSKFQAD